MLSKEIFELKNSIPTFHKGKETLDNLLNSQNFSSEKFQLSFSNGDFTLSSPPTCVEATLALSPITYKSSKAQDSKTKSLKNPNENGKPL